MRNLIITTLFTLVIISCKGINSQELEKGNIDSIAFTHKFNGIPWSFKFSIQGDIFISDDYEIARFRNDGQFISSTHLDTSNKELTPIFDFTPIDSNHFYVSARGNIFYLTIGSIKILNKFWNYNIRTDSKDKLYAVFQEYREKLKGQYNGFRIMINDGFVNYPEKYDYGNDNFEIIDDDIMFYTSYNDFFILPTDTLKTIKVLKIPEFENSQERIWFIGIENNNYVFKCFKNGNDLIYFFDKDLKLIKKSMVNHSFSNNAVPNNFENEYYFQNPSGLLYSYNQYNKSIYILKNVKAGMYIYKLDKCLIEIK